LFRRLNYAYRQSNTLCQSQLAAKLSPAAEAAPAADAATKAAAEAAPAAKATFLWAPHTDMPGEGSLFGYMPLLFKSRRLKAGGSSHFYFFFASSIISLYFDIT